MIRSLPLSVLTPAFAHRERFCTGPLSPAPRAGGTSTSIPGAYAPGIMLSRAPRAAVQCSRFV